MRLSLLVPALLALTGAAHTQSLAAVKVGSGFSKPVDIASPPGDDRLFIVEQWTHEIEILHPDGTVTQFLDLTGLVNNGAEAGFLALAFHPDYANNGRFFVNYNDASFDNRIVEYQVSGDPDVADPLPVQTILVVPQPSTTHNVEGLEFGPDGMLYISSGDGGGVFDPSNNAQDTSSLLGKMLRLDVDIPAPFIPADNPFVGVPGAREEIWAIGLRNPWRFSFDSATGDLYIGDVGQFSREEVHWTPAASTGGENYGWRCMEGFSCTGQTGCTCNHASLTLPIHDYGHAGGNCTIVGGEVYRGPLADLNGTYFFADFCSSRIWSFRWDGVTMTEFTDRTNELEPEGADTVSQVTTFGVDGVGNLYFTDYIDGEIYLITQECGTENYCIGAPNSVGGGAVIGSNGNVDIGANSWTLNAVGSVPNQPGLFFFGPDTQQVPGGDGWLCVTSPIARITPPTVADLFGFVFYQVDFNDWPLTLISPGETHYFQWWYRDPQGPGGTTYNFSDGLRVTFCR